MDKKSIRKQMQEKRDNIANKEAVDKDLLEKLRGLDEFKNSNNFFIFVSCKSEFDTHDLIRDLIEDGKKVYVPFVVGEGQMIYTEVKSFDDLEPGSYGILEPKEPLKSTDNLDFILVPGLAFDKNGYRIGYGGGFYDRFLDSLDENAHRVSVAYDFQIFDDLDPDSYDQPVEKIITPSRVLEIKK
ncbi:MAG: 5-formyltetrahydrofolate cyclo-ligase [Finegoldia sp.]|nr:5-formyltetrahydrofolate cyclo-ligase [Finegoldia sp.]